MLQSFTTGDNMGMVWISHAPEYEQISQVHVPTKMTYARYRNSSAISGQILEYRTGVAIFSSYGYGRTASGLKF